MTIHMVVPARRGSVSIPRKGLQTIGGMTLVERALRLAQPGWDVILATDDERMAQLVDSIGCRLYRREPVDGAQTLDELACEIVKSSDWCGDDVLVMVQATVPDLTVDEVSSIASKCERGRHTVYSAREFHGVIGDAHGCIAVRTANRQAGTEHSVFTGGCIACLVNTVTRDSTRWGIPSVPYHCGHHGDIDEPSDLWLARIRRQWPRVASVVHGGEGIGTGHVVRQKLLRSLLPHRSWVWVADNEPTRRMIDEGHIAPSIDRGEYDIVIVDTPSGDLPLGMEMPQPVPFVVRFSDHNRECAGNIVVCDLAMGSDLPILAPQFDCCLPVPAGYGVLVTFGGEDRPDLSAKAYALLREHFSDTAGCFTVLLGPAYEGSLVPDGSRIVQGLPIDSLMLEAACLVTGRGRTCVEAQVLGRQVFSVALNEYDGKHTHTYGTLCTSVENAVACAIDFMASPGRFASIRPSHPNNERSIDRLMTAYNTWRLK